MVTSAAAVTRDLAWLERHIPDEANCIAIDVTSGEACFAVAGPRSRELLAPITSVDLSNAAFPFGSVRLAELGMAPVRLHRVSYVGELGWEVYVSTDMAREVFSKIAGRLSEMGGRMAGMLAMESCRIEKAYRHFGHDIAGDDHVLEAGLGFAVKVNKPSCTFGHFIGRDGGSQKARTRPHQAYDPGGAPRFGPNTLSQRTDYPRRVRCRLRDVGSVRTSSRRQRWIRVRDMHS